MVTGEQQQLLSHIKRVGSRFTEAHPGMHVGPVTSYQSVNNLVVILIMSELLLYTSSLSTTKYVQYLVTSVL